MSCTLTACSPALASVAERVTARALGEQPKLRVIEGGALGVRQTLDDAVEEVSETKAASVCGKIFTMRKSILLLSLLFASSAIAQKYDIVLEGGRVMDPESGLDA